MSENHYALTQNMETSVVMLEQHYGHTTNVWLVEELTKPKTKRVAKASEEGGAGVAWEQQVTDG